jgi:branched-chain amino acid transport system permease protein
MAAMSAARERVGRPVLLVLILLALLPLVFDGVTFQSVMTEAMIYGVGAVGLDVLTGYSGQYSFGQFVYFAIGAYVMAVLQVHAHWGWLIAILGGVVAAGLIGALVASALVRLRFFGLATGTFFFAAAMVDILDGNRLLRWTGGSGGIQVLPASIGGTSLTTGNALYYTALIALVISALLAVRYIKTRSGIALRVIKENETVAAVMGIRVIREKIRVQVLAACLAGLGGCILALDLGYLSPDSFDVSQSIELFAIVAVGGVGSLAGPILGAIFFFQATNALSNASASASNLFFAIALLIVVILFRGGIYELIERLVRLIRRVTRGAADESAGNSGRASRVERLPALVRRLIGASAPLPPRSETASMSFAPVIGDGETGAGSTLLDLTDVSVRFGGVHALSGVKLEVLTGEVHAIIGPNGAGKTTLLNCISGLQVLSEGSVAIGGRSLNGVRVSSRRQAGIARTFQHPSLVSDLDVLMNVVVGAFESHDGSIWTELLGTPAKRRRMRTARTRAIQALDAVDFPRERWHVKAGDLTMGEQKHVDIARAMAAGPKILLLDEPTAGLGPEEIAAVAAAIDTVHRAGVTILVIAHHVGFVRQIADRCTVLDFGKVIAAGTPEEVLADTRVAEVFLGTTSAAEDATLLEGGNQAPVVHASAAEPSEPESRQSGGEQ